MNLEIRDMTFESSLQISRQGCLGLIRTDRVNGGDCSSFDECLNDSCIVTVTCTDIYVNVKCVKTAGDEASEQRSHSPLVGLHEIPPILTLEGFPTIQVTPYSREDCVPYQETVIWILSCENSIEIS